MFRFRHCKDTTSGDLKKMELEHELTVLVMEKKI